jgi:hypothetical protein
MVFRLISAVAGGWSRTVAAGERRPFRAQKKHGLAAFVDERAARC